MAVLAEDVDADELNNFADEEVGDDKEGMNNKETNNVNFFTDIINDAIESAIGLNTQIIDKIVNEIINNAVEKPQINCTQCPKAFSNAKSYKAHYKQKHDAAAKYYCSICQDFLKTKSELLAYKMVTHPQSPKKKDFKNGQKPSRGGFHNAASGLRSGFHICHVTVSSILIGQEAWRVAFPDATFPRSGTMNSGPDEPRWSGVQASNL